MKGYQATDKQLAYIIKLLSQRGVNISKFDLQGIKIQQANSLIQTLEKDRRA